MELYLIRHGQSTNNAAQDPWTTNRVADPPLTELGRQQAQSTAESLKDKTIAALYCSPYRRALATATITVGSAQRCSTRCLTYLPAAVAALSKTTAASPR
jgi:broad specificity phosphatase PhoE